MKEVNYLSIFYFQTASYPTVSITTEFILMAWSTIFGINRKGSCREILKTEENT